MFERYTEKARRTVFFARYEASQFGSLSIEAEYLLLGLLREDQALAHRLLGSHAAMESIRKRIEGHTPRQEKVSTSVDMPLSHECKLAMAYGAEESKRLNHKHIDAVHLVLGLLREGKSFAAELLREHGLTLDLVREVAQQSELVEQEASLSFPRLDQWLAELHSRGCIWTAEHKGVANRTTHFAIYVDDQPEENEKDQEMAPADKLAQIQKRIDLIAVGMENAIANHEFEKASLYSDQALKERENLRTLRAQFNLEEPALRVPLLCIEIIRDERFSELQKRCDHLIAEGVSQIWLLAPDFKRAYTVTRTEGLSECKGGILQIAEPPLKLDLSIIFD